MIVMGRLDSFTILREVARLSVHQLKLNCIFLSFWFEFT